MNVSTKFNEKVLTDLQAIRVAVPLGFRGAGRNAMRKLRDEAANIVQVNTGNLQSKIRGAAIRTSDTDNGSRISFRSNVSYDFFVDKRYMHYQRAADTIESTLTAEMSQEIQESIDNVKSSRY